MRKSGLALGITVALALTALLVVGVALLREDFASASTASARAELAAQAETAPSERGGPRERAEVDASERAASVAASRDTLIENPPPTAGPTVVFLVAETSRPCPDAEVWSLLRDDVTDEEWDALGRWDVAADPLIRERGHAVEIDAFASATLTFRRGETMLFADAGERHLRRAIALDNTDRLLLRLVRREKLTLLATDPDGRRQRDVPLSLQTLRCGEPWKPPARLRWLQTTDKDGEASLAQGSDLLDEHLDADGLATEQVLVAALAFPCRNPCATLVDARTACAHPVALVTPPRATLRLHAVAPDGRPLPKPVLVLASVAAPRKVALPVQRVWTTTVRSGATTELLVEADAAIELGAGSEDGEFTMAPMTVTAPARAATSDVELVFQRDESPTRAGWFGGTVTVQAPGGAPLAHADLLWQLDVGDAPRADRLQPGPTDAAGVLHFQFRLTGADSGKRPKHLLDVFDGVETPPSRGAKRHGAIGFHEPAHTESAEFVDVGVVELADVPVLVAGRVVDVDGRPLVDVDVSVTERRRKHPRSWTTRTAIDGSFSLRATTDVSELDVLPTRDHWYREDEYDELGNRKPIRCPVATCDLAITLHRNGFARGRLVVDPGISCRDLRLGLLPRPTPGVTARLDADGKFLVEGNPARFSVAVWSRPGGREPVRQVDDVALVEARETVDARLDPIDLLGDLRQIELWVKSASDDAPIADAAIFLTRTRGLEAAPRRCDPFGRALLTTPTFDSALAVGSPEFMFRLAGFERTSQEVRLAPAVVVRVRAEGDVDRLLASPRFAPVFRLQEAAGGSLFQELWSQLPEPKPRRVDNRTVQFLATVEGSYAFSWMRQAGDDRWRRVRDATPVRVRGDDGVVDLVERFSDDEVRAIGATLRK